MIARVRGKLIHKTPESLIVDVNGVGYEIIVPLSTYYMLPELDEDITLNTYTHHKEDSIQLYGFLSPSEKEVFLMLINVSGIGPKVAKNILSGIAVEDFVSAIANNDKARLSLIPGIGAKSAERLILELKDKIKTLAVSAQRGADRPKDPVAGDVLSALNNLGYKPALAEDALKKAKEKLETHGFEELFKEALKILSKR